MFEFIFGSAEQLATFAEELKNEDCFPELAQAYFSCASGNFSNGITMVSQEGDTIVVKQKNKYSTYTFNIDLSGKLSGESLPGIRHLPSNKIVYAFPEILERVAKKHPSVEFHGQISDTDFEWYETREKFNYSNGVLTIRCDGFSDACYTALDLVKPYLTKDAPFTADDFEPKDFTGDTFELSPEAKDFLALCLKKRHLKITGDGGHKKDDKFPYYVVLGNDEEIKII